MRPLVSASSYRKTRLKIYPPYQTPQQTTARRSRGTTFWLNMAPAADAAEVPRQALPRHRCSTVSASQSVQHQATLECNQQTCILAIFVSSSVQCYFTHGMMENADREQKLIHSRSRSPLCANQQTLTPPPPRPALPVGAWHCSQDFPDISSFNPHGHLEAGN